jgi:hypothetical protein
MKNLLFLISALLFAYAPLGAQVEYGPKAGINLADVYTYGNSFTFVDYAIANNESKTVVKPQFGVWINLPLSAKYALRPELLFTQKAWLLKDSDRIPVLNFNYLSLPLMVNYHYNNWRFEVGPEINYLIDQYFSEVTASTGKENSLIEEKKAELALNIGLRYELDHWQFGIRYHRDLTPFASFQVVDVNGEPIAGDPQKYYHQGLQLTLGYRLN